MDEPLCVVARHLGAGADSSPRCDSSSESSARPRDPFATIGGEREVDESAPPDGALPSAGHERTSASPAFSRGSARFATTTKRAKAWPRSAADPPSKRRTRGAADDDASEQGARISGRRAPVFAAQRPELFKNERQRLRYHDPDRDNELVLDLRAEEDKAAPTGPRGARDARRRTPTCLRRAHARVVTGRSCSGGRSMDCISRRWRGSSTEHLARRRHERTFGRRHLARPRALALEAGRGVVVRHATETDSRYRAPPRATTPLSARQVTRRLSTTFRTSSFSALSAGASAAHAHLDDEPDADEAMPSTRRRRRSSRVNGSCSTSFPRSARRRRAPRDPRARGLRAAGRRRAPGLVREHLVRHGFDATAWTDRVTRGVADTLSNTVFAGRRDALLSNVSGAPAFRARVHLPGRGGPGKPEVFL